MEPVTDAYKRPFTSRLSHKHGRCLSIIRHETDAANTFQDPSYDKEPPLTYTCSLCKKSGNHWFSLCPKNTNRDSITQKRLAAGIVVAGAKQAKSKHGEQPSDKDMLRIQRKERSQDDRRDGN